MPPSDNLCRGVDVHGYSQAPSDFSGYHPGAVAAQAPVPGHCGRYPGHLAALRPRPPDSAGVGNPGRHRLCLLYTSHQINLEEFNKRLCTVDWQPVNGKFKVPEGPGLACEISEYAMTVGAEYKVTVE